MDNYGKERQRQSSPPCKSSKFGYNDVDDGPDKDIEEADGEGAGDTTTAMKAIKTAAGNNFDDEDVVKGGLREEIWKRELPLTAIAGVAGKDYKSHYPPSLFSSSNNSN